MEKANKIYINVIKAWEETHDNDLRDVAVMMGNVLQGELCNAETSYVKGDA